jgi:hypothetical protein
MSGFSNSASGGSISGFGNKAFGNAGLLGAQMSGYFNTAVLNHRNTVQIGDTSGWFNAGSFFSGIFGFARS